MKLNWGTNIFIVYFAFVAFIVFMVYLSFGQKYDLVTEDYYAAEIEYQSTIDRKSRAEQLENPLLFQIEDEHLKIVFPQKNKQISGTINCFRPSDESRDFTIEINTQSSDQQIPLNKFIKGKYLIKVNWEVNEIKYYKEQIIIIP